MKTEYRDEIRNCFSEIREITSFIASNIGDSKNAYLQLYLIMRCSGVTEYVFKHLIFDKVTEGSSTRVANYFESEIVKKSTNPKYDNIMEIIKKIDPVWATDFKNRFVSGDMHLRRLCSLVENRNRFAHGVLSGVPSAAETRDSFISACFVLHRLELSLI